MTTQRNFGLDLLRAAAILIVLANHGLLGFFAETGYLEWGDPWTTFSLATVISIEWLFVLSGFLIGTMMIRSFERGSTAWIRVRSFWLRRWFRTVPNYVLFLSVNVLLAWWGFAPDGFTWLHAVFSQQLAWPEAGPKFFFSEAWSLAIDEWFYLVMPLLAVAFFAVRRDARSAFLFATALLILLPMVVRYAGAIPQVTDEGDRLYNWDLHYRRVTIAHLDATGWGVLGAVASRWWPRFWSQRVGVKAALGGTLMLLGILNVEDLFWGGPLWANLPRLANATGLACMGAGTFLALPWIASLSAPGHGVPRVIGWLSLYSYSIYLAHMPLLYLLVAPLPTECAPLMAIPLWFLWLALVFAVSAAVYHSFEKPVSDLRERFTSKVDANPFEASSTQTSRGP